MKDEKVEIVIIYDFGMDGRGETADIVDYSTASLMMKADVISLGNRSYKVKYREVSDLGSIHFYGSEINIPTDRELTLRDIEKTK